MFGLKLLCGDGKGIAEIVKSDAVENHAQSIRRVLPQCGQRAGVLTVCGTRWACASEAAIRGTMAALYHTVGTSWILEGLMGWRGLVEPREELGWWGSRGRGLIAARYVVLEKR